MHGTQGKVYDRVSMTWLDPQEHKRRHDYYEELAFQRRGNQGDLMAPMLISDNHNPVMSMTNGQIYDSKSELRKEYKRADVIEVGNDVQVKRTEPTRDEKRRHREKRRGAIAKALSEKGFGAP